MFTYVRHSPRCSDTPVSTQNPRPDIHVNGIHRRHSQAPAESVHLQSFCLWLMASASLPSIYVLDVYSSHTHSHPPTLLTTRSTHSNATNTFTCTQTYVPLPFSPGHDSSCPDLVPLMPAHAPCVHAEAPTLSPTGSHRLGRCTWRLAERGAFPTSLLSLTCSTCPVCSSLHSAATGLNARVSWLRAQSSGPAAIVLRERASVSPEWVRANSGRAIKGRDPRGSPLLLTRALESHQVSQHMPASSHPSLSSSKSRTFWVFQPFLEEGGRPERDANLENPESVWAGASLLAFACASREPSGLEHGGKYKSSLKKYECPPVNSALSVRLSVCML